MLIYTAFEERSTRLGSVGCRARGKRYTERLTTIRVRRESPSTPTRARRMMESGSLVRPRLPGQHPPGSLFRAPLSNHKIDQPRNMPGGRCARSRRPLVYLPKTGTAYTLRRRKDGVISGRSRDLAEIRASWPMMGRAGLTLPVGGDLGLESTRNHSGGGSRLARRSA
jgi:hypothetical protein